MKSSWIIQWQVFLKGTEEKIQTHQEEDMKTEAEIRVTQPQGKELPEPSEARKGEMVSPTEGPC